MLPKSKTQRRIALTGATGFVGRTFLRAALDAGHSVKALTRQKVEPIEGVEWVKGDLEDKAALAELFKGVDALVHAAGLVKARTREDFFRVNRDSVNDLLALSGKTTLNPDFHFILVSSLAARHPELSPYAESKRAGEEALMETAPAFPWTVVRPPAVYGPGDKEILKLFQAMKRGFAPVAGDEDNQFSLIHARDLAGAILCALLHPPAFGGTLEPDDLKKGGYTIKDIARTAEGVLGRKVRTIEIPAPVLTLFAGANEMVARLSREPAILSRHKVREMAHPNWVSDQASQKKISHWRPEIGLDEGFRETIGWYRANDLL